jgi:LmbE family N-acetylglucosaminyl deacetylase
LARSRLFSGPDDRRIERALCIVAHPDDIEFYCAGTVLRLTRRGAAVGFVLATSGDKGTSDPDLVAADLARIREAEQVAAARRLGVEAVSFLRRPDAELVESLELRGDFVAAIRAVKPDLLLTFDPTPGYRYHPDHRVVGRVALDAAWPAARDRLSFPALGSPHETAEAWCFGGGEPDLVVDVREELEVKIASRLEHRSQTPSPVRLRHRWRAIAGEERFHRVDLR